MQTINRRKLTGIFLIILCSVCILILLGFYFRTYSRPYMMDQVIDLSADWLYTVDGSEDRKALNTVRSGPFLKAGEQLTLYKKLDAELSQATILVRANHQTVNVWLDETHLYKEKKINPQDNPGMALHFIALPENYNGKTLVIEITSPYTVYSGRTSPVLLGSILSLEAWTLSQSMRSMILMSMCLFVGLFIIVLTIVEALKSNMKWQNFCIGVFAVIWALYYVCTEYIVFQFFTPKMVSCISLGLYYCYAVPLILYFYFSFHYYKKWMLPMVILCSGFSAAALLLQLAGLVDLPRLLHINNAILIGLAYTLIIAILEARKGNLKMRLPAVFLFIAYISMLYNFNIFYLRKDVVPYTYKDTYFMLVICVLVMNIQQFYKRYYRQRRESEILTLQNRQARESYEQIVRNLREVGGLKHEMNKHLAVIQAYLNDDRINQAKSYLTKYVGHFNVITDTVFHEHFIINAVVASILQRASEFGIRMELELNATPVNIDDSDLYSMLMNMLENALEACVAVPEGQARYIKLTLSRRNPYFSIICENSFNGRVSTSRKGIKTIKQGSGHGYGLWIIRRIAERYRGLVDIEYNQNVFTLTVALKDL